MTEAYHCSRCKMSSYVFHRKYLAPTLTQGFAKIAILRFSCCDSIADLL